VSFAAVETELAALEARGARGFDRDGCDFVRTLIARGEAAPQQAGALLLERARVHLAQLRERFDRALSRARENLEASEQVRGPLPAQRAAFERGEFSAMRRELRRLERATVVRREHLGPADLREQERRSAAEYRVAAAELNAQFTVARAVEEVPLHAGPYNPLRIATELLSRIGAVSPTYLTAQLQRFEELAVLLTLPEPPPEPKPTPPPKKPPRGRVKRRRSV
jgi:Protein of unknown function (DUF2894)